MVSSMVLTRLSMVTLLQMTVSPSLLTKELNFVVNVGGISGLVAIDSTSDADLDIEPAFYHNLVLFRLLSVSMVLPSASSVKIQLVFTPTVVHMAILQLLEQTISTSEASMVVKWLKVSPLPMQLIP